MTKLNQTPPVIVVGEAIFKIANDYSKKKKTVFRAQTKRQSSKSGWMKHFQTFQSQPSGSNQSFDRALAASLWH